MTLTRTLASLLALTLLAQGTAASWSNVLDIPVGARVTVRLLEEDRSGQRLVRGTLESATPDAIVVQPKKSEVRSIPRSSIQKVGVFAPVSKRNRAWIATGAAVFGLVVGMYGGETGTPTPKEVGLATLLAAAIVAPVALVTFRLTRTKTVFSTP